MRIDNSGGSRANSYNSSDSSGGSYTGSGSAPGLTPDQADAGLKAAQAAKRWDGVENAWTTRDNQKSSGIKAASDSLRL